MSTPGWQLNSHLALGQPCFLAAMAVGETYVEVKFVSLGICMTAVSIFSWSARVRHGARVRNKLFYIKPLALLLQHSFTYSD